MASDEEVLAPVPEVGVSVEPPGSDDRPDESSVPEELTHAAYDDETDLAQPVHRPEVEIAPYAGQVIDADPGAAYDVDRDTGL